MVPVLEKVTCGTRFVAVALRRRPTCMTPDKTATGVPVVSRRTGSNGTAMSVAGLNRNEVARGEIPGTSALDHGPSLARFE